MRFHILLILSLSSYLLTAQTGVWTWMHGSNLANQPGNYGTMGVPSPTNDPPAMSDPATWQDANGFLWMYGGYTNPGALSAMWKFDPYSNQWIWMSGSQLVNQRARYGVMGIPSSYNSPGSRTYGMYTWVDASNDLWLFGGYGRDSLGVTGEMGDLWKYSTTTNEWSWMNGSPFHNAPGNYGTILFPSPSNQPPARMGVCAWSGANGDLWLFSGSTSIQSYPWCYDDVWKYNIPTNTWTWMAGSSLINQIQVHYGPRGVALPSNDPGARIPWAHWSDTSGKVWIFGGISDTIGWGSYADVWSFDVNTLMWTWLAGSQTGNDTTSFRQQCFADTINPIARDDNFTHWVDQCGRFWEYGGAKYNGQWPGMLNDVWMFDPSNNLFTWTSGSLLLNRNPVFGTLLVGSVGNTPGGMYGPATFTDTLGNFWLFGGLTRLQTNTRWNATWKYELDTACTKFISSSIMTHDETGCQGSPLNFSASIDGNFDFYWDFGDASSIATTQTVSHTYTSPGTFVVTVYMHPLLSNCRVTEIASDTIEVLANGESITFPNVFTPNSDSWNDEFPGMISAPLTNYHLWVYDRWGQLTFECNDPSVQWSGNNCSDGTFYWVAHFDDCRGIMLERKGFVTLIR